MKFEVAMAKAQSVNIRLLGIEKTGTKYIRSLVALNFGILLNATHKHQNIMEELGDETRFLIIAKHPLSWLRSMWFAKGRKESISEFIEGPQIDRWNRTYAHMLSVKNKLVIRYEDLLLNPKEMMEFISRWLEINSPDRISKIRCRLGRNGRSTGSVFDVNFYLGGMFLRFFTIEEMQQALRRFDRKIMNNLGYVDMPPMDHQTCRKLHGMFRDLRQRRLPCRL